LSIHVNVAAAYLTIYYVIIMVL